MVNLASNKEFLNAILLHYFNMKEIPSETHRILAGAYGSATLTLQYCESLFKQFESGNFVFEGVEQVETLKKKGDKEIVNTTAAAQLESISTRKKIFFKNVLQHYYNIKKYTCFSKNSESINYLKRTFGDLDRTEQICLQIIKKVKSGIVVFEDTAHAEILEKIEELEVLKRKKAIYVPSSKNLFFHHVLLHYFHCNKKAVESRGILSMVYGERVPSIQTCFRQFKRYKSRKINDVNYVGAGCPKKFKDVDLRKLLAENSSRTQKEIAEILGVGRRVISHRLKKMKFIRKDGNWVTCQTTSSSEKIKN